MRMCIYSLYRGTLRTSTAELAMERAQTIKRSVMSAWQLLRPAGSDEEVWRQSIMKNANYKLQDLRRMMVLKIKGGEGRL